MTEQNQTENNPPPAENTPPPQPKDTKGRFAPKTSAEIPPNPPDDQVKTLDKDPLLDEIEHDLKEALKGRIDPKDLEGLDQRMRIKMLRILSKVDNGKRAGTIDPTNSPPPQDEHIPTLAELNRSDKYRADMLKQGSYIGLTTKWRQGK